MASAKDDLGLRSERPCAPGEIGDFGLAGQQPDGTGPVPTMLHGMISLGPAANRIYFGYGTSADGLLQIVDRDKLLSGPKEPTDDNLCYPEIGRFELSPLNGANTTFPVIGIPIAEFAKDKIGKIRNFVVVTDEQIANECQEARQFVWFVDATVEKHPISVATWGRTSLRVISAAGRPLRHPRVKREHDADLL